MDEKELTTVAPKTMAPIAANPMDMPTKDFKAGLTRRKANRDALIEWIKDSLIAGVDYQRIKVKGRWSKPFLTKAGSEKVLGLLGVTPTFPNVDVELERLSTGQSTIIAIKCDLKNGAGDVVATGAGGRTLEQDSGDINKCLKMCLKSAMIDATLRLGGLSELFTQDEESAHDDLVEKTISKEQQKVLIDLAKEAGLPIKNVCTFYNIKNIDELPEGKFLRAKKAIEKRKKGEKDGSEESTDNNDA